ncbi:MAG: oligosaccharide flippase family protein [Clostridiales bacterium]|nr:oligosaccharide flippase family protein [Clostridiales bacterium]
MLSNSKRRFFLNGLILTSTSLLMRFIGVAFNSFVSNKIGADGMGLFTLIMSVYGFTVTVASSGVNLAATRLCAEARDGVHRRAALRRCLVYAGVCGTIAACGLGFGADFVAVKLLGDERCTASLRLLAVSMPFIALSNVLHGYFSATRKIARSSATQIFEQLFKIFVTTWGLLYLVPDGIEYACMALVGGGALAETVSFLMALICYLVDREKRSAISNNEENITSNEKSALTRELFGITLPIAAAAYVRSALTTLEHILIPRGLRKNPATSANALAAYGILCGMVMPVIMLPTAFLYSFTGLLVPEYAEAKVCGDSERVGRMTSRALGLTLIYSIGCAGLMLCFSNELGMLIYGNYDAGEFIRIMAPLIPVMYLDHAVDAMLKGLGEQLYSMKVNILDAALSALLVFLLCSRIGIYGYVVTIYISELVNASLSIARLLKAIDFRSKLFGWLVQPLICISLSIAFVQLIMPRSLNWGSLICRILTATAIYICLIAVPKRRKSKSPDRVKAFARR